MMLRESQLTIERRVLMVFLELRGEVVDESSRGATRATA